MELEQTTNDQNLNELVELVSFNLGEEVFGIDILGVQEINRMTDITQIPQAPCYCEGIINLRGKVIPVINLRKKFQLDSKEWDRSTRILVCEIGQSVIGMIVDSVDKVLKIPKSTLEQAPEIVSSIHSDYIEGIAKLEEQLLIFLNVEKVAFEVSQFVDSAAEEQLV